MIFYFKKIKGALELGIQKYILYNYPQQIEDERSKEIED
jgi:hypothetical protein